MSKEIHEEIQDETIFQVSAKSMLDLEFSLLTFGWFVQCYWIRLTSVITEKFCHILLFLNLLITIPKDNKRFSSGEIESMHIFWRLLHSKKTQIHHISNTPIYNAQIKKSIVLSRCDAAEIAFNGIRTNASHTVKAICRSISE